MPATLVIVPSGAIRRTTWFPVSQTYAAPSGPIVKPDGSFISAAVAGPPSPAKPFSPVPATTRAAGGLGSASDSDESRRRRNAAGTRRIGGAYVDPATAATPALPRAIKVVGARRRGRRSYGEFRGDYATLAE